MRFKQGARIVVGTTHTGRHVPCLSATFIFFSGLGTGGLMNSLLIPLSGESDCSGRSSRGLSPAEAAWLLSHQQPPEPCPWQKLSQPVPRPPSPPASPQSHALLPPELASIHFNGRDLNPVFLELAAICLSPRPCLGWCLCISISQLGCGMLLFVPWMGSLSVCLSSWHSYPQLEPADPSSLPSCPSPPGTSYLTRSSLKLSECLSVCPSLLIQSL